MNGVAHNVVHYALPRQGRIWHCADAVDRRAAIFPKLLIAALCWIAMFLQQIEAAMPGAVSRAAVHHEGAEAEIHFDHGWHGVHGCHFGILQILVEEHHNADGIVSEIPPAFHIRAFRAIRGSIFFGHERIFYFDSGGNRARQTKERIAANDSRKIEFTLYLGSYEREIHQTKANGTAPAVLAKTVHRHSLGGGVIYTRTAGGADPGVKLLAVLADHLGSTDVIVTGKWNTSTAAFANITTERQSFDAWGERRAADTQVNYRATDGDAFRTSAQEHHRGYTGHEQLDDSGLIHMNGRIYDPELGRFLSPDPYVQIPEYSQNFNRYSYVLNNPLNATDPSGFSFLSKFYFWGQFLGSGASSQHFSCRVMGGVVESRHAESVAPPISRSGLSCDGPWGWRESCFRGR
jgi:RHS repeat-associated protein